MITVQEITAFQTLTAEIQQLRIALEARNPERYDAQISNSMPWIVDYKGRKHVYMLSPVILTITATDIGNINIPPGVWYLIDFPEGMRVTTTNQPTPVYIHIQASDEILIPGAVALVQDGTGIGANVNLSQIASVAVNPAVAQLGTNIAQVGGTNTGLSLPIFDYPAGAVPIAASSGNVANAAATATLPGVAGKTTYISGFDATSDGATGVLIVLLTITNLIGGVTFTYVYTAVAGATTQDLTLTRTFSKPIPASATNTAIAVSLPALGAGNTNAAVNAHGYQL